jgi:hypothetical protein
MRVNRRFLYAGVFLVAIGGVLVAADLGVVDTAALTDTLRLWPLAVIAVGLSLVLRRTQFSLPGGMLAAAVPGLVLGGAFAIAPRFAGDCGAPGEPAGISTQRGNFDGPASVSLTTGCGSINVNTAPGNGWQLAAGNTARQMPSVRSSARSLSIDSIGHEGWHFLDGGRDTWDLTLPTSDIDGLSMAAFASHGRVALAGARIGRLDLTSNASEIIVDASAAFVGDLSGVVNVGSLSIQLPADGDLVGSLRVGGGKLQVCTPPGLGLRVTTSGGPKQVTVDGLQQTESEWQSPNYVSAAHRADLRVSVNFGAVEIDPIGGCR